MDEAAVRLEFGQGFAGVLRGGSAEVPVGQGGGLRPYELLLGALGSCFYSTFLGIAAKMRLEYDSARVDVRGVKRDEVPTTLKDAWLTFTIIGAKDEKGFRRAAELAA
ncbi:MAG TPA: OsmC family protein [Candidatus Limnocylindria bacterium]|nr:OsmC family protein [Candidatus Limnocylindria bacterium]